jgi:predicted transcriptional regulator
MQTVDTITPRAAKIMDLVMQGLKPGQIAERIGLTRAYVSTLLHAPQFQHQLAIRRGKFEEKLDDEIITSEIEAANVLRKHSKEAAERMVQLLDSSKDEMVYRASADILDRTGVQKQPKNTTINQTAIVVLDEKRARLIQETLEMSGDEKEGM